MKRILCGDLIPGCTFQAKGKTDAEVLHNETDHVRGAHGIEVTPQFLARARGRIVEDEPAVARPAKAKAARRA